MAIQANVNASLTEQGGKLRVSCVRNDSGPLVVPADMSVILINCDVTTLTLSGNNTVSIRGGTITGAVTTTATDQLLVIDATMSGAVTATGGFVELNGCTITGALSFAGTRAYVTSSDIDVTGATAITCTAKTSLELLDTTVDGDGTMLSLTNASAVVADSPLTTTGNGGIGINATTGFARVNNSDITTTGDTTDRGIQGATSSNFIVANSVITSDGEAVRLVSGSSATIHGVGTGVTETLESTGTHAMSVAADCTAFVSFATIQGGGGAGNAVTISNGGKVIATNCGTIDGNNGVEIAATGGVFEGHTVTTLNGTVEALDVDGGSAILTDVASVTTDDVGNVSVHVSGGSAIIEGSTTIEEIVATGGSVTVTNATTVGDCDIDDANLILSGISNTITDVNVLSTARAEGCALDGLTITTLTLNGSTCNADNLTIGTSITMSANSPTMRARDSSLTSVTGGTGATLELRNSTGTISGFGGSQIIGNWAVYG